MKNKIFTSLEHAIKYVTDIIFATLDVPDAQFPKGYNDQHHKKELALLFTHSTIDLFSEYNDATKQRLSLAL